MIQHYRNLSGGTTCACTAPHARPIRIQSAACQQGQWDKLLLSLGADLLYALASGTSCIIHDRSDAGQETRACWQGLSWIRYATSREWRGTADREYSRSGMDVTGYWEQQFRALPASTRRMLAFYGQYYKGGKIDLYSCWMPAPAAPSSGVVLPFRLTMVQPTAPQGAVRMAA